jgi:hypothetical protein
VCEGLRYKSTAQRECYVGHAYYYSTSIIGKEAFLGGPTYLVKTDLYVPVSRKKEICFPDTILVTHGSADSPVAGAL